MKKGFEKSFMKLQSEYVALCLEVPDNSVEKIYIYLSIEEKSKMFNVFVRKADGIYTLNKLGIDRDLYMRLLKQGTQDIEKVEKLCKKYKAPTPTEMKMVYDVTTGKYQADYQYVPVCTDRSAGEIVPSPKKQTKNAGKKPNEKNDKYNIKLLYPTAFIPRFA